MKKRKLLKKLRYKKGDIAIISKNISDHQFHIDQEVEILQRVKNTQAEKESTGYSSHYKAKSKNDIWFIGDNELK